MGLSFFKSSGCYNDKPFSETVYTNNNPNPNKYRFNILEECVFENGSVVVIIQYPDATNYEAKKVLVYKKYKDFFKIKKETLCRSTLHKIWDFSYSSF